MLKFKKALTSLKNFSAPSLYLLSACMDDWSALNIFYAY